MRRGTTLGGVVALLVLALLGTAAPGYADSYVHRDSTKDVVRVPRNGSTCSGMTGHAVLEDRVTELMRIDWRTVGASITRVWADTERLCTTASRA